MLIKHSTPEFKDFLDQWNLLGSRVVDAAASGRNKQMMNDVKEMIWSLVELASDPSTVAALAEVTASLCHALEMEDSVHRTYSTQRRRERNAFTRQAYADHSLVTDPDTTAEQVIMSSLGGVGANGVPSAPQSQIDGMTTIASVDEKTPGEFNDWKHAGKDGVDIYYLQSQISQRADQKERERMLQTTITTPKAENLKDAHFGKGNEIEDLVVTTVTDKEDISAERQDNTTVSSTGKNKSNNLNINIAYEGQVAPTKKKTEPRQPGDLHVDVEHPVDRFYRNLDEMLSKHREEATTKATGQGSVEMGNTARSQMYPESISDGKSRKNWKKASSAIRFANSVGSQKMKSKRGLKVIRGKATGTKTATKNVWRDKKILIGMAILVASVSGTVWFGFGCYGVYVLLFNGKVPVISSPLRKLTNLQHAAPVYHQEVIVKVIREIVHVEKDGSVISSSGDSKSPPVDEDQVAACVANAVRTN